LEKNSEWETKSEELQSLKIWRKRTQKIGW
jgi:hypothetical protein